MQVYPLIEFLQIEVATLVLVLTRIAAVVSFGPLYGTQTFPNPLRFYLVFLIGLVIAPVVAPPAIESRTMVDMVLMILGEMLIGFILGNFLRIVLQALQVGGQLVGQQMGLSLANVVNPQLEDQASTLAVVYVTVASFTFIITGGDLEMFAVVLETFEAIPLGAVYLDDNVRLISMAVFQRSMIFALRVSAPATVALILVEIAMAFVGRTVPQLNVLSVGFALRIVVGFAVTITSMTSMGNEFYQETADMFEYSYQAISYLIPAAP